jgi:hypothetical protein
MTRVAIFSASSSQNAEPSPSIRARWRATQGVAMKKPLTIPDEPQPRNITRADLVMTEGFGLEVDGRMKTVFPTLEAAQKRAKDLKAEFPMLQVKVYDAAEKKLLELSPTE